MTAVAGILISLIVLIPVLIGYLGVLILTACGLMTGPFLIALSLGRALWNRSIIDEAHTHPQRPIHNFANINKNLRKKEAYCLYEHGQAG